MIVWENEVLHAHAHVYRLTEIHISDKNSGDIFEILNFENVV